MLARGKRAMTESADERAQTGQQERPAMERAEELVDRLGQRAGTFASLASLRVRKLAARAREEAEDVWAEARSIRQGRQS